MRMIDWPYLMRFSRAQLMPRPLKRIFRQIARYQDIRSLSVLELFARKGDWHTIEYAGKVRALELWEINPEFAPVLASRFPRANVLIGDTYRRLQSSPRTFNVIIGDSPVSEHEGHFEHFDIFPYVFGWLADDGFLILDIIPFVGDGARRAFPEAFGSAHMRARKAFYGYNRPDQIPIAEIIARYRSLCEEAGWTVQDTAIELRNDAISYLLLALRKTGQ